MEYYTFHLTKSLRKPYLCHLTKITKECYTCHLAKTVSKYDQEMHQSQTADQPMAFLFFFTDSLELYHTSSDTDSEGMSFI